MILRLIDLFIITLLVRGRTDIKKIRLSEPKVFLSPKPLYFYEDHDFLAYA